MPDFSQVEWGFVLAAAFCNGFLVRTFGAGVGLVITPFLIFAFSPTFSLGLIALFSCWSSLGAAPDFWGKWNLRYVFLLAPGIIIGLACGVWLLTWLPGEGLKLLIGAICFVPRLLPDARGNKGQALRNPSHARCGRAGASAS